ncbi:hypothetical protein BJY00DRAFT_70807 [Aspergillus carlsbadensis]|nr:hypothetical protein BJY00DRAFT_70807 [Aspergillus carlsbadensis]
MSEEEEGKRKEMSREDSSQKIYSNLCSRDSPSPVFVVAPLILKMGDLYTSWMGRGTAGLIVRSYEGSLRQNRKRFSRIDL